MIELNKKTLVDVELPDGTTKKYSRGDVRFIAGKFYIPDVTCFRIRKSDGTYNYFRYDSGMIGYNVEENRWDLIGNLENDSTLIKGVYNEKGNFGYFKINPFKNVHLVEDASERMTSSVPCLNQDIAEKLGYVESVGTGVWVNKKNITTSKLIKLQEKAVFKYDKTNINYNADESNNTYLNILNEYNKNKHLIDITGNTAAAAKLLDNYTFGFEIETSNGTIPKNLIGALGVVPLKDGSLRDERGIEPYEYTTIPLTGEKGLETMRLLSKELNKRCEFNSKCSVHIHISGVNQISEDFCIALYKLCYNIQDQVYALFPAYKTNPEKYVANFHKNYCAKLPKINFIEGSAYKNVTKSVYNKLITKDFDQLYYYLSDNMINKTDETFNLNSFQHPKGQTQKWNLHARYHWVNLVPFIFTRKRTVEWRLHTPTLNFAKLSSWLFICSAIMKFVENNKSKIITEEIQYDFYSILAGYINNFGKSSYIDEYGQFVSEYLIEYCKMREDLMKKDLEIRGDAFGNSIEYEGEKKFNFSFKGQETLY